MCWLVTDRCRHTGRAGRSGRTDQSARPRRAALAASPPVASAAQTVPSMQSWYCSGLEQSPPSGIGAGLSTQVPAQQLPEKEVWLPQIPWFAHSSLKKQAPPAGSVPVNTFPQVASSLCPVSPIAVCLHDTRLLNTSMHAPAACPSYTTMPAAISVFMVASWVLFNPIDARQVARSGAAPQATRKVALGVRQIAVNMSPNGTERPPPPPHVDAPTVSAASVSRAKHDRNRSFRSMAAPSLNRRPLSHECCPRARSRTSMARGSSEN